MWDEEQLKKLAEVIPLWYTRGHRLLPWRETKEPYRIWLSEIMLQQTRVEAVRGYYTRFLEQLPTVEALANADDEQLHKLWEGLGYYSRVRNLKKAAQVIMEKFGGRFPNTHEEILSLPGIGPYTAGAIGSIAFNLKTPAVDGNVLRVMARLGADERPVDTPAFKKEATEALAGVYPENAGDFTQGLMELGATVCGPDKAPRCESCPCKGFCKGQGIAHKLPVRLPKRERRVEEKTVLILSCNGKLALRKRPDEGLLAGLWELPNFEGKLGLQQVLDELQNVTEIEKTVHKKHVFTHIQWNMTGFYIRLREEDPRYLWFSEDKPALPTAFKQFLQERTEY